MAELNTAGVDRQGLLKVLSDIKAGKASVDAPVYSHLVYNVVPERKITVERPDILIVEGLNVLQPAPLPKHGRLIPYVSDFFDFAIYVDAEAADVRDWYIERFLQLRETAFAKPESFFRKFADLSDEEARRTADQIWTSINLKNLKENILPTRQRADLILRKRGDHLVESVTLRKL